MNPPRARPRRPPRHRLARPRWPSRDIPAGPNLPDWDTLVGGARQAAWDSLTGWVSWLHDRYELSVEERLPHCWAEHPGLVEELSALRAWRLEIWTSAQPSGQAARYWHAEMRQTIAAATTFYAAGCRAGHHAAQPVDPKLRHRWFSATAPGDPGSATAMPQSDGGYLSGTAMTAHLATGRAITLSDTVTGYLRHDESWWEPARSGWQRVTDQATVSLLDHHAQVMARADQAVRRAAAMQTGAGQ
jgi:hypothetical protein